MCMCIQDFIDSVKKPLRVGDFGVFVFEKGNYKQEKYYFWISKEDMVKVEEYFTDLGYKVEFNW